MILGITGPLCAGTDTLAEILKKQHGFTFFSYSDILREEAKKRNIELTRKNLQDLGDELRKAEGRGVLSKRIIEKIELAPNADYAIGNIRNPGEVEELRKKFGKNFILIKIDAPQKIRFQRLSQRRREKDPQTFEEFLKVEERDLGINQGEHGQQHAAVFALADKTITNDSTIEELARKVSFLIQNINN